MLIKHSCLVLPSDRPNIPRLVKNIKAKVAEKYHAEIKTMKRFRKMNKRSMWNYPDFTIPGMECVSETTVKSAAVAQLESTVEYVTLCLNSAVNSINFIHVELHKMRLASVIPMKELPAERNDAPN